MSFINLRFVENGIQRTGLGEEPEFETRPPKPKLNL